MKVALNVANAVPMSTNKRLPQPSSSFPEKMRAAAPAGGWVMPKRVIAATEMAVPRDCFIHVAKKGQYLLRIIAMVNEMV